MPKEMIDGHLLPYGEEGDGRSVLEIRWGRDDGYIQVVSKCVNRYTGERYMEGSPGAVLEIPKDLPEVVAEELRRKWTSDFIHYTDGFYVDLDRRGINQMIRVLRRARVQAFGKDE